MVSPLNVLILGTGAIGTYIGASLLKSGQNAVFLERPEWKDALLQSGIQLTQATGVYKATDPVIVSSIAEALENGPFDAAVAAVKSFDTQNLAESLSAFNEDLPPLICMQNGVENEDVYARYLGTDKVIAGTLTTAIGRGGTGHSVVEKLRGMGISLAHTESKKIIEGFSAAGLNCRGYKSAASMKWSKLMTNVLANASSAILNFTPKEIFEDKRLFRLEALQLAEVRMVMAAQKIAVTDLPGTPVRLLVSLFRDIPEWFGQKLAVKFISSGRGNKMPSFHIDLRQRFSQVEVDYLNGAVVRFGEKVGVETPVNRFLNDTLIMLANQTLPLDYYEKDPERLLADYLKTAKKRKL